MKTINSYKTKSRIGVRHEIKVTFNVEAEISKRKILNRVKKNNTRHHRGLQKDEREEQIGKTLREVTLLNIKIQTNTLDCKAARITEK